MNGHSCENLFIRDDSSLIHVLINMIIIDFGKINQSKIYFLTSFAIQIGKSNRYLFSMDTYSGIICSKWLFFPEISKSKAILQRFASLHCF